MSGVARTHRPDIKTILLMNGWTIELNKGQSWYETGKRYEIWHDGPEPLPHRVTYFSKANVCFVTQHDPEEGHEQSQGAA